MKKFLFGLLFISGGFVFLTILMILQSTPKTAGEHGGFIGDVQERLHAIVSSRLYQEPSLDVVLNEAATVDMSVVQTLGQLQHTSASTSEARQAILLEENILERLHELILSRQSNERSLKSALYDPLKENPLASSGTLMSSPKPNLSSSPATPSGAPSSQSTKEMAADTVRRRSLFATGAKNRWMETRARIQNQIMGDLRRLDGLLASAVL